MPDLASTAQLLRPAVRLEPPGRISAAAVREPSRRPLTRFGVRYLLGKHVVAARGHPDAARQANPSALASAHDRHLPAQGRQSTSPRISQWLGHATLNATMRLRARDLDLKRQALAQVFPDALAPPKAGNAALARIGLFDWLRRL